MIRSAGHVGVLACALVGLTACTHKTSIVGTWTREHEMMLESGEPDPREQRRYITYNADGTFHFELYSAEERDPINLLKGTYKLRGNQLTTEIPPHTSLSGDKGLVLTDGTVTVSGDTMTLASDTSPWRRVSYPYHFVDHSLDLVGKWKDKHGAILELRGDGAFTAAGVFAEGMVGSIMLADGSFGAGGGMAGSPPADGAHKRGPMVAKPTMVRTVRGSGRGFYTYEGRVLTLDGSFTPSSGTNKGRESRFGPTMILEPRAHSTGVLHILDGARHPDIDDFVRSKQ